MEGKTLREMLSGGPLPNDKLIRYATQMAEGRAKAHQAGIVHRDLKPENTIISDDGYIKILDFGLAKLLPRSDVGEEVSTLARETTPGAILGTVGYMSPEQAKGESADFRSDQFAFGVILHEMMTGDRPFDRPTAAETLAAIIREEPSPMSKLTTEVPDRLVMIANRCLLKEAGECYDSTRDLVLELKGVRDEPRLKTSTIEPGVSPSKRIASIVVLHLVDLRDEPGEEYFVDGMTEALITDLAIRSRAFQRFGHRCLGLYDRQ